MASFPPSVAVTGPALMLGRDGEKVCEKAAEDWVEVAFKMPGAAATFPRTPSPLKQITRKGALGFHPMG